MVVPENDDRLSEEALNQMAEDLASDDSQVRARGRDRYAEAMDEPDFGSEMPEISDEEVRETVGGSKLMIKVLREQVVPKLRGLGFKGRHPHFRRFLPERVDLLAFQMNKWGGSFCVEIAQCPPEGYQPKRGDLIPAEKMTPWHLDFSKRLRLGSEKEKSLFAQRIADHWFAFQEEEEPLERKRCERAADEALAAILDEGERWWNRPRRGLKARLRDLWHWWTGAQ